MATFKDEDEIDFPNPTDLRAEDDEQLNEYVEVHKKPDDSGQ
jgi:hypothetical protein